MNDATPLQVHRGSVLPQWIDYNGHMNMGYYVVAFDHGTDGLLDYLGMDEGYRARTGYSTFTLETHVTYERELKLDDPFRVTAQLLDWDPKRLHYFEWLHHDREGYVAATTELILMHMAMASVRPVPMPGDICERVEALMEVHASLARPEQVGQTIGIRRKT
jgi:acyl-CoA thioester hydrolase